MSPISAAITAPSTGPMPGSCRIAAYPRSPASIAAACSPSRAISPSSTLISASQLADPGVAGALEWPGLLAREHGRDYEIWTGADPVYLAYLRFLAGYRRPWL